LIASTAEDGCLGPVGHRLAEDVQPGHVGEPVVQEDQVDQLLAEDLQPSAAVLGLEDLVPLLLQPFLERPADQLLVLDDQDSLVGHC
jgi:hypothetical protein